MNTQQKHTPGPWQFSPGHDPHNQAQIYGDDGKTLAVTFSDEGSANAALIAAAPVMLEALRYAAELIPTARRYFPKSVKFSDRFQLENVCATIGKAIAQAEGGAQ